MSCFVIMVPRSHIIRQSNLLYFINRKFSVDGPGTETGGSCSKVQNMAKKLRAKTPIGKLDEIEGQHPQAEKEPLKPWPDNTNPFTGEIGGPKGPEPTRYGDWERKGRVTDF